MRSSRALAVLALLWVAPSVAAAQSAIGLTDPRIILLPGSVNVSAGTLAPTEDDNVLASITVEQGVTAWHRRGLSLVGFVNATRRHDSQGLSWNRTTPMTAGVSLALRYWARCSCHSWLPCAKLKRAFMLRPFYNSQVGG